MVACQVVVSMLKPWKLTMSMAMAPESPPRPELQQSSQLACVRHIDSGERLKARISYHSSCEAVSTERAHTGGRTTGLRDSRVRMAARLRLHLDVVLGSALDYASHICSGAGPHHGRRRHAEGEVVGLDPVQLVERRAGEGDAVAAAAAQVASDTAPAACWPSGPWLLAGGPRRRARWVVVVGPRAASTPEEVPRKARQAGWPAMWEKRACGRQRTKRQKKRENMGSGERQRQQSLSKERMFALRG